MTAQIIAWTYFVAPDDVPWQPDDVSDGEALAEFAGRACYQSWTKPNPATATNLGYIKHILEVGHLSVLEHPTATIYFTGVTRTFTHELIRHRHMSYSQLSQRFVPADDFVAVYPPVIADDPYLTSIADEAVNAARNAYDLLRDDLEAHFADVPGLSNTERKKRAREAARAVLPNATETRIVVTANYRAWRHFIALRATRHADQEIRAVAVEVLRLLQKLAPAVFADFEVTELPDGTEVAASCLGFTD